MRISDQIGWSFEAGGDYGQAFYLSVVGNSKVVGARPSRPTDRRRQTSPHRRDGRGCVAGITRYPAMPTLPLAMHWRRRMVRQRVHRRYRQRQYPCGRSLRTTQRPAASSQRPSTAYRVTGR